MSNIVHLNKEAEAQNHQKPNLDEDLKTIVRHLARQAAKEYFESYQVLESEGKQAANSNIDSTDKTGV